MTDEVVHVEQPAASGGPGEGQNLSLPPPIHQLQAQQQQAQQAAILQNVPFPNKLVLKDPHSIKEDWEMFAQIWRNYNNLRCSRVDELE